MYVLYKSSTSLVIREMQIKTMMKYHFISVRMAFIKWTRYQELIRIWKRGHQLLPAGGGYGGTHVCI